MPAYRYVRRAALVTLLLTLAACSQQAVSPPQHSQVTSQGVSVLPSALTTFIDVRFYSDAAGIAISPDGSVYTAGVVYAPTPSGQRYTLNTDALMMKLTPDGQSIWRQRLSSNMYNLDSYGNVAYGVAVDRTGNVYFAGRVANAGRYYDPYLRKYDANGNLLWAKDKGLNHPIKLRTAASGAVIAAGFRVVNNESFPVTAQYSPDGTLNWFTVLGGYAYNAISLAVDPQGRALVANGSQIGLLRKLDQNGKTLFAQSGERAVDVAAGADGSSYVLYSRADTFYLTRLDPSGHKQWETVLGTGDYTGYTGWRLALDPTGNVIVAGLENSSAPGSLPVYQNVFTKVDSQGSVQWKKVVNLNTSPDRNVEYDGVSDFAVDASGRMFVIGNRFNSAGTSSREGYLARIDP